MEQKAESIVYENFLKMVNKYPNKHWDWYEISYNKNFKMKMIEKYPNINWEWWTLSVNPNFTFEMIEKYPDKNGIGVGFHKQKI